MFSLEVSRDTFKNKLAILKESEDKMVESHYTIESKNGNAYQVITTANAKLDSDNKILYTRSFTRNETNNFFQHTLNNLTRQAETSVSQTESKDRFTRQLFHETKTPCQILMALKYNAKFKSDEDYKAFCIAIDSLSNLALDMSILTGNTNNGECLATETTMMDYTNGIISNLIEIGDILGLAYQNAMPEFIFQFDDDVCNMHHINRLLPRAMYHLIRNSIQHSVSGDQICIEGRIIKESNQLRISVINKCEADINIDYIKHSYDKDILNDLELHSPTTHSSRGSSIDSTFSQDSVCFLSVSSKRKSSSTYDKGYGLKIVNAIAKALHGRLDCKCIKLDGMHKIQFDIIVDINRGRSQEVRRRSSSSLLSNTAANLSLNLNALQLQVESSEKAKAVLSGISCLSLQSTNKCLISFSDSILFPSNIPVKPSAPKKSSFNRPSFHIQSEYVEHNTKQIDPRRGSIMSEYSVFSDKDFYTEVDDKMSKLHGLVVEDSKMIQKLLKKGFIHAGLTCDFANNGQEAVDMLKKDHSKYDFITMDLRMPVMDGIEATKCIRQDLKLLDIPIIVLSAEFSDLIKERAKQVGSTSFVEKPVNMISLTSLIDKLCTTELEE